MTFTITFGEPQAMLNYGADYKGYVFPFTMIDSAFIGTPEETSHTSHRNVCVTASPENSPWPRSHLSESDLISALFYYGMRHITDLIRTNALPSENPIQMPMIHTGNAPDCPLTDLSNIPSPSGWTFQVEQERTMGFHPLK